MNPASGASEQLHDIGYKMVLFLNSKEREVPLKLSIKYFKRFKRN